MAAPKKPAPSSEPPKCVRGLSARQIFYLHRMRNECSYIAEDLVEFLPDELKRGKGTVCTDMEDLRDRGLVLLYPPGKRVNGQTVAAGYQRVPTLENLKQWLIDDFVAHQLNGDLDAVRTYLSMK